MGDPIVAALAGQRVLHVNSLATVTEDCIVITAPGTRAQTILPLVRVSQMKVIKTTHPVFLVVSAAALVVAAAAQISTEGGGAAIPIAGLSAAALAGYFVTRRAAVAFVVDEETTETSSGSLRQADALIRALQSAQSSLARDRQAGNDL